MKFQKRRNLFHLLLAFCFCYLFCSYYFAPQDTVELPNTALNSDSVLVGENAKSFANLGEEEKLTQPVQPEANTEFSNSLFNVDIVDNIETEKNPEFDVNTSKADLSELDANAGDGDIESEFLFNQNNQNKVSLQSDSSELDVEYYRKKVVENFRFAFNNYVDKAWGYDEIHPCSGRFQNSFGGFGVTVVDSITTLALMNLTSELHKTREFVKKLNFDINTMVSVFEVNIRVLGGLIGAYDLTNDRVFLEKAVELAERLAIAYDTPHGLPVNDCNLKYGHCSHFSSVFTLAQVGTFQLEYERLSAITGNEKYSKIADRVTDLLQNAHSSIPGLLPTRFSIWGSGNLHLGDKFSVGGDSDSYYEYLLKTHLLLRGKKPKYLNSYNEFVEALRKNLVQKAPTDEPMYILGHNDQGTFRPQLDHLACFLPGTMALGYMTLPNRPQWELELAEGMMTSCYQMYKVTPFGLSPDCVVMGETFPLDTPLKEEQKVSIKEYLKGQVHISSNKYLLRPETVESLFYLYRATKNTKYIKWAMDIFESILKQCKSNYGFTSLNGLDRLQLEQEDHQPSYFLSETMKYLYLIVSPEDVLSFDKFVLNTEAHPFKRDRKVENDLQSF